MISVEKIVSAAYLSEEDKQILHEAKCLAGSRSL